jgi:hypothetical protein
VVFHGCALSLRFDMALLCPALTEPMLKRSFILRSAATR